MIIAVDFDGTIVDHEFPDIGEPIGRSLDVLIKARQMGHILILWSCRVPMAEMEDGMPHSASLEGAVEWCKDRGLEFDAVNENFEPGLKFAKPKILADWYIDDRALMPGQEFTPEKWDDIEMAMIGEGYL